MSWQAYVDTSLVGTGDVDKAAIFNTEGNSVWASSPNFHISPTEMAEVVACYKDNAKAFSSGFHVGGTKYLTIKADERSLYGKQGKVGIIIVRTKQAMLVAHHPETVQAGVAANTVEKLGDYLIGVGY